jgi:hypothetical protein
LHQYKRNKYIDYENDKTHKHAPLNV